MANQTIFKRYEYKYLLTADQKKDLQAYMETYMKPDTFGRNTICNLYFDTSDYLLIRRSIEGKVYKEKIRLRTYGRAQHDSEAFIELKKKLKDGTFTIDSCDDSLHTNGNLSICGGTYTLSTGDDGMHADEADQVYGGEITIKTCYEGIEGQNMEISGGTIDITASDDGLNAAGGNDQSGMGGFGGDMFSADEDAWITISGGTVTIDATGDGIDSNGDLTVSGGNIFVSGPSDNGNGALDYNGTVTITGGTLVAAGMSGMEQNFGSDSTQGSLMMNLTDNQSGEITLEDADGNTLVSYTPMREYNSVVISCAELSDGSTYTIHTGENSQEVTMEGLVYTDGEVTNAPGQGGGQKPQGGPMGDNSGDSDNSDNSDRPTLPQGQGNPPDTQNGERPQGDAPQGNPGDSSNEQTKEESDGQK